MSARLNVNIDHVATVRQARRAPEPSLIAAAMLCEMAGADGITIHLRGDRRHIQDADLYALRQAVTTYLNVEMAATEEMMEIAHEARPDAVTLVAERPDEITTEGGLDVRENAETVRAAISRLRESGLFVSIFIDPEAAQIEAARDVGAHQIELCTAAYAEATLGARAVHGEA
ncbi:MAG: pyridoxine 5'-phosphate synthase, partial [Acidobacteria bacterium]|nr:pyridoxine 5'-phosphate synthase [Acidobacteriota bacterium]